MKFIENRSAFLDNSLNELRDVIFNSRFDAREDLNQKFLERRRVQKKKQQEIRAEKYAEFDSSIFNFSISDKFLEPSFCDFQI